jgi:hypothetical protein
MIYITRWPLYQPQQIIKHRGGYVWSKIHSTYLTILSYCFDTEEYVGNVFMDLILINIAIPTKSLPCCRISIIQNYVASVPHLSNTTLCVAIECERILFIHLISHISCRCAERDLRWLVLWMVQFNVRTSSVIKWHSSAATTLLNQTTT